VKLAVAARSRKHCNRVKDCGESPQPQPAGNGVCRRVARRGDQGLDVDAIRARRSM
jgi:hypothetical protein